MNVKTLLSLGTTSISYKNYRVFFFAVLKHSDFSSNTETYKLREYFNLFMCSTLLRVVHHFGKFHHHQTAYFI